LNIWKKITIMAIMVLTLLVPTAVMADTSTPVGLETTVVTQTISFSVDPSSLGFGSVIAGQASTQSFVITNTGNVPIKITASLPVDPGGFYTAFMTLSVDGITWTYVSGFAPIIPNDGDGILDVGESVTIHAKISPPIGWATGSVSGQIIFYSEYAP
jgi:hypothetical protein